MASLVRAGHTALQKASRGCSSYIMLPVMRAAQQLSYAACICCVQTLSAEVASYLGLELGKIKIKRFADGEIYVQVQVGWWFWHLAACGASRTARLQHCSEAYKPSSALTSTCWL